MDFLNFLSSLVSLITSGINNLISFIKFVPELLYTCYSIIPSPFKELVLVFAPLIIFFINK